MYESSEVVRCAAHSAFCRWDKTVGANKALVASTCKNKAGWCEEFNPIQISSNCHFLGIVLLLIITIVTRRVNATVRIILQNKHLGREYQSDVKTHYKHFLSFGRARDYGTVGKTVVSDNTGRLFECTINWVHHLSIMLANGNAAS